MIILCKVYKLSLSQQTRLFDHPIMMLGIRLRRKLILKSAHQRQRKKLESCLHYEGLGLPVVNVSNYFTDWASFESSFCCLQLRAS